MIIPRGSFSWSVFIDSEVEIGQYTAIAKGCVFHGVDNHITAADKKQVSNNLNPARYSKGKIVIGNDVWIGESVRILSGSLIGDGAIVGAGAVIAGKVKPYSVVVGNPMFQKGFRFEPYYIDKLLQIKWYEWPDEKIKEANERGDFNDITKFVELYA